MKNKTKMPAKPTLPEEWHQQDSDSMVPSIGPPHRKSSYQLSLEKKVPEPEGEAKAPSWATKTEKMSSEW